MHKQTRNEEIANWISHLVGFIFAIALLAIGTTFTSIYKANPSYILSYIFYCLSIVTIYLASFLYHFVKKNKKLKSALLKFDHLSIFIIIIGTYTPIVFAILHDLLSYVIYGVIISVSLYGIYYKIRFADDNQLLFTIIFNILGWLSALLIWELAHKMLLIDLIFLIIGGLLYTIGSVIFAIRFKYNHLVWHIFILLASLFHYFSLFFEIFH